MREAVGNMTERFCSYCLSCINDCKRRTNITECVNYSKMIQLSELNEMITEQNVNIRRLCKDNNLKYYIMTDYLKGKKIMKYKYYKIVLDRLMEHDEFLPYIDEGVVD